MFMKRCDLHCLCILFPHLFVCLCSPPTPHSLFQLYLVFKPPPNLPLPANVHTHIRTHIHRRTLIGTWRSVKLQPRQHCWERIAVCSACLLLSSHPPSFYFFILFSIFADLPLHFEACSSLTCCFPLYNHALVKSFFLLFITACLFLWFLSVEFVHPVLLSPVIILYYCRNCSHSCLCFPTVFSQLSFYCSLQFTSCLSRTSFLLLLSTLKSVFFISINPPSAFLSCVFHHQSRFHLFPSLPNTHYHFVCLCQVSSCLWKVSSRDFPGHRS